MQCLRSPTAVANQQGESGRNAVLLEAVVELLLPPLYPLSPIRADPTLQPPTGVQVQRVRALPEAFDDPPWADKVARQLQAVADDAAQQVRRRACKSLAAA